MIKFKKPVKEEPKPKVKKLSPDEQLAIDLAAAVAEMMKEGDRDESEDY